MEDRKICGLPELEFINEIIKFALNGKEYICFGGYNCKEYGCKNDNGDTCRGWDGYSSRCDCGNRRVRLMIDIYDRKSIQIYGSAY